MNTLTIKLPVDGLPCAAELPDNFSYEARFLLAVKLFEQGRISSGKAGLLCDMGRVEFLLAASRSGVPVVDLSGDELAEEFINDLRYATNQPGVTTINVMLNSPGGDIYSAISIIDVITEISKLVPVVITVSGHCMSAATLILQAGTKRLSTPNSRFMIHELSTSAFNQRYTELKNEVEECTSIMLWIQELYSEKTKLPKKKLDKMLKKDSYFNAKKALEYGLIDEVL